MPPDFTSNEVGWIEPAPLAAFPAAQRSLAFLADRAGDMLLGARGCLLTFHRVATTTVWPSLANRDFYIDLDFLDTLLDHLEATGWSVVTIEEALRRARGPAEAAGRFVNFSIDDTYRDTWELAVPLFRRHRVPLTLFVTTGIPDGGYLFWSQGLEALLNERDRLVIRDEGQPVLRQVSTWQAKSAAFHSISARWEAGDPAAEYAAFCADNGTTPEALHERLACTWDMLASFVDDPCVEIGGHTVTHPHVSKLEEPAAEAEIGGCRTRLERRLGIPVRHFAFPFGRKADCGPRDFALARAAGFASASTTRKGILRPGSKLDAYSLPRCTLNGAHRSLLPLAAHLSGATGVAARMSGRI